MKLLWSYLRRYRGLLARHVIDRYAMQYRQYTTREFLSGVSLLLGAAVGVAFDRPTPRSTGRAGGLGESGQQHGSCRPC